MSEDGTPPVKSDAWKIMDFVMQSCAAKTLMVAVNLDLFTELGSRSMTGEALRAALQLSPRAIPDFPDTLVALGFLKRAGEGEEAQYSNADASATCLDASQPGYIGGMLKMRDARTYHNWAHLEEGLKTGRPQNEISRQDKELFAGLYEDEERLSKFVDAMAASSLDSAQALAQCFDFQRYNTLCDVGGGNAQLCRLAAARHPHLSCTTLDLPAVLPIARRHITEDGLSDQVHAAAIDFRKEPFPKSDVITMSRILHNWDPAAREMLIGKAYDALPDGGAFVTVESFIDDERRDASFALLMSLNMLLEFGVAENFSARDLRGWCEPAGFQRFEELPLGGAHSAVIAYK